MTAGEAVPVKVREYAATSMSLSTRDEIFSAMVVYGFLSYEDGKVSIPNKELMEKFVEMLQKEPAEPLCGGRILAVGIGYDKKRKNIGV